jgi:hypothetical protein
MAGSKACGSKRAVKTPAKHVAPPSKTREADVKVLEIVGKGIVTLIPDAFVELPCKFGKTFYVVRETLVDGNAVICMPDGF